MPITLQGWMRYLSGGIFNQERGTQLPGPDRLSTSSGIAVSDNLAMTIGAVFRSIRIIAEVSSGLPLRGYRRLPNGDREELPPSHWLARLIERPNPVMSGDQWAEAMYAQTAGWGNAYSQIVRNANGRPVELWPEKVDRMRVERLANLEIQYKYPDVYGREQIWPASRVFHMRAFTLDGVMGLSPLGLSRGALGLALQAENYAGSFFSSGGRPAGVMTSDRVLTQEQRGKIEREYSSMSESGTGKRFWLLEGSLKYEPLTVNPEDLQMLQTRAFQVADIARFFGVPLFLLMETEKSTSWGSGIEQQNLAFLTYTLRPYLQDMATTWNRSVIPESEAGEIFVDVDVEGLQTADFSSLSNFLSTGVQNGYMTRNEARRRLKKPRAADGNADALTVQVNLTPLANLGDVSDDTRQELQNAAQIGDDILRRLRNQSQRSET